MMPTKSEPAAARPSRPWPAERIEYWPIERLTAYANNPRAHSDDDEKKVMASICQWGWTMPVLVDEEGRPIAGDLRVRAGKG